MQQTIIAADLDGTLAESKLPIKPEMAEAISRWLKTNRFAVISGAGFPQFEKQVVAKLPDGTKLENLFLFPTNGAICMNFKDGEWREIYKNTLTDEERERIFSAIKRAVEESGIQIEKIYGEQTEYRGGQVTFSALGQQAPLSEKAPWDPDQEKRKKIVSILSPLLPDFTITIGGATSIDVTRKGIDKEFAIGKIKELLNAGVEDIIFFGDAIFPGGNDWPAAQTGVRSVKVSGPEECLEKINSLSEKFA